jgi:hypothetical protein
LSAIDTALELGAVRQIVGWCADVHEANPHAVKHDGPCGLRFYCPDHRDDGYRRAEVLRNGDLILHCEGLTLRRSDPCYAVRVAGLAE